MRRSRFACERCGSLDVRRSRVQSIIESIQVALGSYPLRCEACQHRFMADILLLSQFRYARCPQCLSFHLTTWDPEKYHLRRSRKLLLWLGAHRYRCNICRLNFVSFRAAKHGRVSSAA